MRLRCSFLSDYYWVVSRPLEIVSTSLQATYTYNTARPSPIFCRSSWDRLQYGVGYCYIGPDEKVDVGRVPCFEYPHKTWNSGDCKDWHQNHLGDSIHISKCCDQHLHNLIVPVVGSEVQGSYTIMIPGVDGTLVVEKNFHDIMVAIGCCQM